MKFSFGETLCGLRRNKKLTQKALAEKMSGYGFEVNHKSIYNWEKGLSQPNIGQFLAICDILGVDDILWQFAGIHSGPYSGLNADGRAKARELMDLLFSVDRFRDEPQSEDAGSRMLRLYDLPVSAGGGNFLDDSGYEMIEVPAYVPANAEYALRVSGDSMEPLFQDGQIIWLQAQEVLNSGEIGVFEYDDNVYLKKLVIANNAIWLRSLNPAYSDIGINAELGLRALGKVVS